MIHIAQSLTGNDDARVHNELTAALTRWAERIAKRQGFPVEVLGAVGHAEFTILVRDQDGNVLAQPASLTLFGGMMDTENG